MIYFLLLSYNTGIFGSAIGGSLGQIEKTSNFIGKKTHSKLAGKITGGVLGATGKILGTVGGALLPFKDGGKVMAPKGKPIPAILHGQEYVLPSNAKPTKAQITIVAMNKRNMK